MRHERYGSRRRVGNRMRIYVDFDDVVCETARTLCVWAHEWFGVEVPYERVHWFDLRRSLGLNEEQYQHLMERAHEHDALLQYPPAPDAVETLADWQRQGFDVTIVTGRPASTRDASRAWLARYGLEDVAIIFVDKYQREPPAPPGAPRALTLEEFGALTFDVAVDDAPLALDLLLANPVTRVFVFDRPWNRDYMPACGQVERAVDWAALAAAVPGW